MWWMLAVACVPEVEPAPRKDPAPIVDTGRAECDPYVECCPMGDADTGMRCVPERCCHTSRGCYWTDGETAWECGDPGELTCIAAMHEAVAACSTSTAGGTGR